VQPAIHMEIRCLRLKFKFMTLGCVVGYRCAGLSSLFSASELRVGGRNLESKGRASCVLYRIHFVRE
jgi:hypothetical protein